MRRLIIAVTALSLLAIPVGTASATTPTTITESAPTAARVTAAAVSSCTGSGSLDTTVSTSVLAYVSGQVYVGLNPQSMTVGDIGADQLACGGIPRVGDRFYVRVASSDVQGGGDAALFTPALRLPPGVYPWRDGSNPVYCYAYKFTAPTAYDNSITCPDGTYPDSIVSGDWGSGAVGWDSTVNWNAGSAYSMGQRQVPAGWTFYGLMPVYSTRPLHGLASPRGDWLWSGADVSWVGGAQPGFAKTPLIVNDRAVEVSYPASPVTSVTNTSASATTNIANYWKAGAAVIQFGTTTAYGSQTPSDPVPGNDPQYSAYSSQATLAGLVPGTTYHWRGAFIPSAGTPVYGADHTFTTTGSKPKDSIHPTIASAAMPTVTLGTTVRQAWSASDNTGLAGFAVQTRTTSVTGTIGLWRVATTYSAATRQAYIPTSRGTTICARVTALDLAGNQSTGTIRCTTTPFDERSISSSGTWSLLPASTAYFGGTLSRSVQVGASKYISKAKGSRVVLVATKTVGGGSVTIRINGVVKATLSLAASATLNRQTLVVPITGGFSGAKVEVRVATTGSAGVRIDGLGVVP
jgi:hypothetical protein